MININTYNHLILLKEERKKEREEVVRGRKYIREGSEQLSSRCFVVLLSSSLS